MLTDAEATQPNLSHPAIRADSVMFVCRKALIGVAYHLMVANVE